MNAKVLLLQYTNVFQYINPFKHTKDAFLVSGNTPGLEFY